MTRRTLERRAELHDRRVRSEEASRSVVIAAEIMADMLGLPGAVTRCNTKIAELRQAGRFTDAGDYRAVHSLLLHHLDTARRATKRQK